MANTNIQYQTIDMKKINSQKEDDLFYFVDANTLESEKITAPRYSYWRSVFRTFFKKKINWFILGFLAILILMIFIYPIFAHYDAYGQSSNPKSYNLSPSAAVDYFGFSLKWIFGTGALGESIFDGIWASALISLSLAIICAVINMVLGILIGSVWGYSKRLDMALNVVYNIVADVPYILLITVLVYIIGSGFFQFVFALTVTGWLGIAYFFRTQVLIIRDREYNMASRCLGTPMAKVVQHNVLPFLTSVIVTILATELPSYISMEVYLSYLGIGLSASIPSLGHMIEDAQTSFIQFPWAFWAPVSISAAITIILYVLGQNLADASDPRTHMQ